jgi:hypothetical protein
MNASGFSLRNPGQWWKAPDHRWIGTARNTGAKIRRVAIGGEPVTLTCERVGNIAFGFRLAGDRQHVSRIRSSNGSWRKFGGCAMGATLRGIVASLTTWPSERVVVHPGGLSRLPASWARSRIAAQAERPPQGGRKWPPRALSRA